MNFTINVSFGVKVELSDVPGSHAFLIFLKNIDRNNKLAMPKSGSGDTEWGGGMV